MKTDFSLRRTMCQTAAMLCLLAACLLPAGVQAQDTDTLWIENFEDPSWEDDWHADAGTWNAGVPTSGPGSAFGGSNCAGTKLGGSYPANTSTRFIRHISFVVPPASDNPRLGIWHWFAFNSLDYGRVQIRTNDGDWKSIGTQLNNSSGRWTNAMYDLSAYADSTVQVAFYFYSKDNSGIYGSDVSSGWYVDNISLVTGPIVFNNPEDFESGIGDWWANRGVWQVGKPTGGPGYAHSGERCAGTCLSGNYPSNQGSSLYTPWFVVPDLSENPRLRYWHWFNSNSLDYGRVYIQEKGESAVAKGSSFSNSSGRWTEAQVGLSAYAGDTIRALFYYYSKDNSGIYGSDVSSGWYIDDVEIATGPIVFNNPEDWESGIGDWWASRGVWQVGKPTGISGGAHSGERCAGTCLSGNYPATQESYLVSPSFIVPSQGNNPRLRFYHKSNFNSQDYGEVRISVNGNSWRTLLGPYNSSNNSSVWTRPYEELSAYADSTVRFAFFFHSQDNSGIYGSDVSTGWYIDDIVIESDNMPPDLRCWTQPKNIDVCQFPADIREYLKIYYVSDDQVDAGEAIWSNDTLNFTADAAGVYVFDISATNAYGTTTCEVTVNVTQNAPTALDTDNLTFFTYDTAVAAPDPQMIRISSTCPPGSVDWSVSVPPGIDWLGFDKTSGSNPDSVQVLITKTHMQPGIYTTMLEFVDNSGENQPVHVNLTVHVESGVDVGDAITLPGNSFNVPIKFFTSDSLEGFTLPLKFGDVPPVGVIIDSVTVNSLYADTLIYNEDSTVVVIRPHPFQPPPPPDSVIIMGHVHMTAADNAPDQRFLIDTTTTEIGGETYTFEFTPVGEPSSVPFFNPGVITIGTPSSKILDLGDVTCPRGGLVNVPAIATGIRDLAGFDLVVTFDHEILTLNDPPASSNHFTLLTSDSPGILHISSASGLNNPAFFDGDTIFTIGFTASGDVGQTSALCWGDGDGLSDPQSNPIQGVTYYCGSVTVTEFESDLAGVITYYSDQTPLADVTAALSGAASGTTITLDSGWYGFDDLTNGVYRVTPASDAASPEALQIFDVVKLMRYLLGQDPLSGYQLKASDCNLDNLVTISDVVFMMRDIVIIEALPCGPWAYVDEAYAIDATNWMNAPNYIERTFDGSSQMDLDFLGVRMGDVKGDYYTSGDPVAKTVTVDNAEVVIAGQAMTVGTDGNLHLPISLTNDGDVAGFQLTLKYDRDQLNFVDASSELVTNYLAHERNGEVKIAWIDPTDMIERSDGVTLINLRFTARTANIDADAVILEDGLVSDVNGDAYTVALSSASSGVDGDMLPTRFALSQNYPNPFNPVTQIEFALPVATDVRLDIYNIMGQRVVTLVSDHLAAGNHSIAWRGDNSSGMRVASGVYLYRLQTEQFTASKKMILMK